MEAHQAYIQTPLGITVIRGNDRGISSISVSDSPDIPLSKRIPDCLADAGGLWRKKWLLEHESPYKQQSLF